MIQDNLNQQLNQRSNLQDLKTSGIHKSEIDHKTENLQNHDIWFLLF